MHKEWLKYIPSDMRDLWKKMGDDTGKQRKRSVLVLTLTASFRRSSSWSGACTEAGVPILAGTDTYNPYVFPELTASTKNFRCWWRRACRPWQHCKPRRLARHASWDRQSVGGTVEVGKVADLVLLDQKRPRRHSTTPRPSARGHLGRQVDASCLARCNASRKAEATVAKPPSNPPGPTTK